MNIPSPKTNSKQQSTWKTGIYFNLSIQWINSQNYYGKNTHFEFIWVKSLWKRPRKCFVVCLLRVYYTIFTMTDVSVWYKNLPIFTKYWLSLTIGISLLSRFGLIPGEWLYLAPYYVYYKFHFWRLITWYVYLLLSMRACQNTFFS